ncbi:MAG: putative PEP-binding protein, partial [Pirellulales bacterium]
PAVIRLIDMAIRTANQHSVPINLCGQMSGSTTYTMLLAGLGLRSFSVRPAAIPEIKRVCRSVTIEQCEAVAERVRTMDCARDIKSYLKDELHKVIPEPAE